MFKLSKHEYVAKVRDLRVKPFQAGPGVGDRVQVEFEDRKMPYLSIARE